MWTFQQWDNSPYTAQRSIGKWPCGRCSQFSRFLFLIPVHDARLDWFNQPKQRDVNFPKKTQDPHWFPQLQLLGGFSRRQRCASILRLYGEPLPVPARQVFCGFIRSLNPKNSMSRSCILRSAIVGSALTHGLTFTRTDADSHCNGCYEYYMSQQLGEGWGKGECTRTPNV